MLVNRNMKQYYLTTVMTETTALHDSSCTELEILFEKNMKPDAYPAKFSLTRNQP